MKKVVITLFFCSFMSQAYAALNLSKVSVNKRPSSTSRWGPEINQMQFFENSDRLFLSYRKNSAYRHSGLYIYDAESGKSKYSTFGNSGYYTSSVLSPSGSHYAFIQPIPGTIQETQWLEVYDSSQIPYDAPKFRFDVVDANVAFSKNGRYLSFFQTDFPLHESNLREKLCLLDLVDNNLRCHKKSSWVPGGYKIFQVSNDGRYVVMISSTVFHRYLFKVYDMENENFLTIYDSEKDLGSAFAGAALFFPNSENMVFVPEINFTTKVDGFMNLFRVKEDRLELIKVEVSEEGVFLPVAFTDDSKVMLVTKKTKPGVPVTNKRQYRGLYTFNLETGMVKIVFDEFVRRAEFSKNFKYLTLTSTWSPPREILYSWSDKVPLAESNFIAVDDRMDYAVLNSTSMEKNVLDILSGEMYNIQPKGNTGDRASNFRRPKISFDGTKFVVNSLWIPTIYKVSR